MIDPVLSPSNVAVVTGGASGIGLAAAKRFAATNLRVCTADLDGELAPGGRRRRPGRWRGCQDVLAVAADVSRLDEVRELEKAVRDRFRRVDVLMNKLLPPSPTPPLRGGVGEGG